jgi:hypothetical protein
MWVRPTSDPSRAVVIDPLTKRRIPPDGIQVPDHSLPHLQLIGFGDLERFDPKPVSIANVPALLSSNKESKS